MWFSVALLYCLGTKKFRLSITARHTLVLESRQILFAEKTASALRSIVPSVHAHTGPKLEKFSHGTVTLRAYTSGALMRSDKPYSVDCCDRINVSLSTRTTKRACIFVAIGCGASNGSTPIMRTASSKDMWGFNMMMRLWSYKFAAAKYVVPFTEGVGAIFFERLISIGSSLTNNCWNSQFIAIDCC